MMRPPREEDVQHLVVRAKQAVGHMWDMPFSHSNRAQRIEALRLLNVRLERELGITRDGKDDE